MSGDSFCSFVESFEGSSQILSSRYNRKYIMQVAAEVDRLEALKASKMKELVRKKRSELEDICRKTHIILESESGLEFSIQAIETGELSL